MASTTFIDDLPYEMLVEIFTNVSFEDLVHSVQHVCTRWQEASRDNLLWKDLVYCPHNTDSDSEIASALEQTPKLQTLILCHEVGSEVIRTIAYNCTQLKRLEFVYSQGLSISNLEDLVQKCPNIESFIMSEDVLYNLEKMEIIGQFRNLVRLYMEEGQHEHPVLLKPLADGCPALRSIFINKTILSGDLEYFILKKKDQLRTLSVRWCTADFKSTVPLLSVCTALKTLVLHSYSDVDVEASFQALRSFTTVTSLTLFNFHNANVNNIMSVFRNRAMDQLEELYIEKYNNYADKLGAVIIENCPRLKALYFSECNNLTDESVKNFHTLHELQYVNLNDTRISDGGMESIKRCKNLKYLILSHCYGLTERSMQLIIELSGLHILVLENCDINGLPLHLIQSCLKHLILLGINHCRNVDEEALAQLKADMRNLIDFN